MLDPEAAFRPAGRAFASLVFKGGTSLSKAYGAIRRFSEDIDLSFNRAALGYEGDRDPEKEGLRKKKAAQLIDELVVEVERHIAEKLFPALRGAIVDQLGEPKDGKWSLEIDANDAQTVNFHYPEALEGTHYAGMAYITPRVKLELGARGDPWPTEDKVIRPYAAEDFPDFFSAPDQASLCCPPGGRSGRRQRLFMPRRIDVTCHRHRNISRATITIWRC